MNLDKEDLEKISWEGRRGSIHGKLYKENKTLFVKLINNKDGFDLINSLKQDFDENIPWCKHTPRPVFCKELDEPYLHERKKYRYVIGYEYIEHQDFNRKYFFKIKEIIAMMKGLMSVFLKIYCLDYVYHDICWLNITKRRGSGEVIVVDLDSCIKAQSDYTTASGSRAYHQLFLSLRRLLSDKKVEFKYLPFLALCQMWFSMAIGITKKDINIFWYGGKIINGTTEIDGLIQKIFQDGPDYYLSHFRCRVLASMFSKGSLLIEEQVINVSRQIIDERQPTFFNRLLDSSLIPAYHAGFWRRFAACLFDTFLTIGIGGAILVEGLRITPNEMPHFLTLLIGFNWLYYTLLESSSKKATIGKMAFKIIVTDLKGHQISFLRANGRYWGKIISAITLLSGFIIAGFTPKKQARHDIYAGTLVVRTDP